MKSVIVVSLLLGSCGLCLSKDSGESYPRVTTPLGQIEGTYKTSFGGRLYESYEGLPYALAPIGDLRFEVPKPVWPWKGVRMAKEFGPQCIQYNPGATDPASDTTDSEDCLHLNVYTPVRNYSSHEGKHPKLFPVIFYIHGGLFLSGAGSLYGPRFLLDRHVTLVTINYRLGPLGFLSTEDNIVSGNMGLKDQVVALRWVNDNIRYFGGDPSRITLVGQSIGGSSVQYHYMSKLTRGLFQRGMSLSGTTLNPWVQSIKPLEKAKKLAVIVGCTTHDTRSMVDCLKTRPARQIMDALSEFTEGANNFPQGWGVSIEKGGNEFTFVDRSPIDILASRGVQDLPWVTGVVSEEGAYVSAANVVDAVALKALNEKWETLAPFVLFFNDTIPKGEQPEVARLIKEHYLGENAFSRATLKQTTQLVSDQQFFYTMEEAARSQARVNQRSVYVYYFSYRGAHSYTETVTGTSEDFGVCHFDDVSYVLESFFDSTSTPEDRAMQQVLIDLWVSYATDGTPNVGVKWPRLTQSSTNEFSYLHIAGPKKIGMESASNFGNKEFWRTIPFNENILQSSNVDEEASSHSNCVHQY